MDYREHFQYHAWTSCLKICRIQKAYLWVFVNVVCLAIQDIVWYSLFIQKG